MESVRKVVLFFKSHIDQYVRKDGTVVGAHDDKRQSGKSEAAKYGTHFKPGEKVVDNYGKEHEVLEHVGVEVKTVGGQSFHPTKVWRKKG